MATFKYRVIPQCYDPNIKVTICTNVIYLCQCGCLGLIHECMTTSECGVSPITHNFSIVAQCLILNYSHIQSCMQVLKLNFNQVSI